VPYHLEEDPLEAHLVEDDSWVEEGMRLEVEEVTAAVDAAVDAAVAAGKVMFVDEVSYQQRM
jgi:hypothetical protein